MATERGGADLPRQRPAASSRRAASSAARREAEIDELIRALTAEVAELRERISDDVLLASVLAGGGEADAATSLIDRDVAATHRFETRVERAVADATSSQPGRAGPDQQVAGRTVADDPD